MNADRLNRWLNLTANIGVLIGVIFVAVELRQNSNLARASTRQEIAHDSYEPALAIATDEGLAAALQKSNSGQELTPTEEQRLITLVYATNAIYDNIYFQYRSGMLEDEQWEAFLSSIRNLRGEPTNQRYLDLDVYSEPYQELVRQIDAEL